MGREIRRVPPGWEHPKDKRGRYIPMMDKTHWGGIWSHIRYDLGWYLKHPKHLGEWFSDWPRAEEYRPAHREKPTHYQMYETVSEGTPVSPVFATPGKLEAWLVEQGHSQHAAHAFVEGGWAPSMTIRITPAGANIKMGVDTYDD
jgi:hypothetical protein